MERNRKIPRCKNGVVMTNLPSSIIIDQISHHRAETRWRDVKPKSFYTGISGSEAESGKVPTMQV
jgi:hypothetical protein